jgi:hypothetical protein
VLSMDAGQLGSGHAKPPPSQSQPLRQPRPHMQAHSAAVDETPLVHTSTHATTPPTSGRAVLVRNMTRETRAVARGHAFVAGEAASGSGGLLACAFFARLCVCALAVLAAFLVPPYDTSAAYLPALSCHGDGALPSMLPLPGVMFSSPAAADPGSAPASHVAATALGSSTPSDFLGAARVDAYAYSQHASGPELSRPRREGWWLWFRFSLSLSQSLSGS